MLKKTLYILLILSISGLPNMAAISFVPHKCCCSETPMKDETPKKSSCCSVEHEEQKAEKKDQCDYAMMDGSSLTTCGCVHEYTSTDETTLVSIKDYSQHLLVVETIITEQTDKKATYSYSRGNYPEYLGSVPIYISVSSYLI